jgi:hypothetical protein
VLVPVLAAHKVDAVHDNFEVERKSAPSAGIVSKHHKMEKSSSYAAATFSTRIACLMISVISVISVTFERIPVPNVVPQ